MKTREFSCVNYMFTQNHDDVIDMYKETRKVFPDNILKIEKTESGFWFVSVYDFVFEEKF